MNKTLSAVQYTMTPFLCIHNWLLSSFTFLLIDEKSKKKPYTVASDNNTDAWSYLSTSYSTHEDNGGR